MMKQSIQKAQDKISPTAKAQSELETYLNAGSSLKRWEYFMKAMTVTPSSFRNGDLSFIDVVSDMVRFDRDSSKVLFRLAMRHGLTTFTLASLNVYGQNKEFISEFFEIKGLQRSKPKA